MNIKLKYPIGAVLIILGVATCNYYYQKKNQQRVMLDDKAVNSDSIPKVVNDGILGGDSTLRYDCDTTNIFLGNSTMGYDCDTCGTIYFGHLSDSATIVHDSMAYHIRVVRIDTHYIKINGIWHPGKVYK